MKKKIRIVHYVNQFFGQEGGEDKADMAFIIKEGPVGPGSLLEKLFGDEATVVASLVCGDNYFSGNVEKSIEEGIEHTTRLKPDLFFAGPAFNAGRYGIACGALAAAVQDRLGIPSLTGMFPENPAVDLYRRDAYIVKTGASAGHMREAMDNMVALGRKLYRKEPIGSAESEGYLPRGSVKNENVGKSGAVRGIELLLAKIRNDPFETELALPQFESIPPAPRVKNIKKAKIAVVSDGGLVPKGNPHHFKMSQNTVFAAYDIEPFVGNPFWIAHSGYHHSAVRGDVNRLIPVDVLREMAAEGVYGSLLPVFYSTSGNTTTVQSARAMGRGIAEKLRESGVDAVILTST